MCVKFVPVLTTSCMLGLKFLELFFSFLWVVLGFHMLKIIKWVNVPVTIFVSTLVHYKLVLGLKMIFSYQFSFSFFIVSPNPITIN